jgi:ribonuclease VapC
VGIAEVIVIDTSAIIAILNKKPESIAFRSAIAKSNEAFVSAVSYYEAMLVYSKYKRAGSAADVTDLLEGFEVTVPFEAMDAEKAFTAYMRFGKGFHPKARLNLCDCAAFALAEKLQARLLYNGEDFKAASIPPAH